MTRTDAKKGTVAGSHSCIKKAKLVEAKKEKGGGGGGVGSLLIVTTVLLHSRIAFFTRKTDLFRSTDSLVRSPPPGLAASLRKKRC